MFCQHERVSFSNFGRIPAKNDDKFRANFANAFRWFQIDQSIPPSSFPLLTAHFALFLLSAGKKLVRKHTRRSDMPLSPLNAHIYMYTKHTPWCSHILGLYWACVCVEGIFRFCTTHSSHHSQSRVGINYEHTTRRTDRLPVRDSDSEACLRVLHLHLDVGCCSWYWLLNAADTLGTWCSKHFYLLPFCTSRLRDQIQSIKSIGMRLQKSVGPEKKAKRYFVIEATKYWIYIWCFSLSSWKLLLGFYPIDECHNNFNFKFLLHDYFYVL